MPRRTPEATLHPPRQERSRRTLDRIVRASLDLIAERGVEATTIHDIVRRARSSVGSFYARFDGKEALLLHLEENLWRDALSRWEEALGSETWDELGLAGIARAMVGLVLETYRVGARQRALLAARRPGEPPSESARAFHLALRGGLRRHLLARREEIAHPEPFLAVDVALRVLVGAVRELEEDAALHGALPGLDDRRLVEELTRLVLAYLGAEIPDDLGSPESIDFFDVWG